MGIDDFLAELFSNPMAFAIVVFIICFICGLLLSVVL